MSIGNIYFFEKVLFFVFLFRLNCVYKLDKIEFSFGNTWLVIAIS